MSCVAPNKPLQRDELIALLEREMKECDGWERVHAADALLDHGATASVASAFSKGAETAQPPYRIGAWRIMARAAALPERQQWVERIRGVLLDAQAPDRLPAAESLAKLGVKLPHDEAAIEAWMATADNATAPFPLWLLALSSSGDARCEARLVQLLESDDEIARLRAGFALGRMDAISFEARRHLVRRAEAEPAKSPARAYLVSAALLQSRSDATAVAHWREVALKCMRHGRPPEQLELATAIGKCGTTQDAAALQTLLKSREADACIGGASGLLYLME